MVTNESEKEEELVVWNEEEKNGSYIEKEDYIVYGLGYPGILASKYVNNLTNKYIENKDVFDNFFKDSITFFFKIIIFLRYSNESIFISNFFNNATNTVI